MGASQKRRVKGTGGEEPWGDEHFQNPPDQSGWNDKKKAAFDRLRKKWSAENGDQEDSTSTDAGGFGDGGPIIRIGPDNPVTPLAIRSASAAATGIFNPWTKSGKGDDNSTTEAAGQNTTTNTTSSGTNTSTPLYTIGPLESNPSLEAQPEKKKIDGDLDASEVDAYISRAQRSLAKVTSLNPVKMSHFSANHLALQVVNGTELVYVYPVTIVREQTPQKTGNNSSKLATSQTSNNSQGYPNVSAKRKRRIFELLIQALQTAIPNSNTRRATKYKTQIATVDHELIMQTGSQATQAPFVVNIRYYERTQAAPSSDPWVYQVAISSPKRFEIGRLQRTLDGNLRLNEVAFTAQQIEGSKTEYLDLFNMLITQRPNEAYLNTTENSLHGMALAGLSKHYPYQPARLDETYDLRNGLSALHGFYRSARLLATQPRLQLNVNTSTSAFYRWENLQQVISDKIVGDFQDSRRHVNLAQIRSTQWQELERFVRGIQVRARYNNVNSLHTVTGLAMTEPDIIWNSDEQKKKLQDKDWPWDETRAPIAKNVEFCLDQVDASGNRVVDAHGIVQKQSPAIQLLDYYNKILSVPEVHENHFVIRTGGGEHVLYFPANLLTVLPGQHYKGQIAIKVGARTPLANRREIEGSGKLTYSFDTINGPLTSARFGLALGNHGHLLQVQGERLGIRNLQYRTSQVREAARWNLMNTKCLKPPNATKGEVWSVIEFTRGPVVPNNIGNTRNFSDNRMSLFVNSFKTALTRFGIDLPPQVISTNGYHSHKIPISDENAWARLRQQFADWPHVKLWVILLPEKNVEAYSWVKMIGDLQIGVSTVCHVKKNLSTVNQLVQLCTNICLKANLKLSRSSANHALTQPSTLLSSETMVVGIDVTHSPQGARKNSPSVAAIVASIDRNFAQWPASIKLNARDESDTKEALEEVQELKSMMIERLACYRRHNGKYPKRIVIYRDGLSEGQFEMARTREFGRIMAAIEQIYNADSHPDLMLICAVKRHHTRFFPTTNDPRGATRGANGPYQGDYNPAVGTAFYDTVTYGDGNDFFLVSQNAMKGATVRPTHYVVLVNTCGNASIRDVANMTLDLCFLFGRATVSVGLATPAYYADLACTRGAKYLASYTRVDPRRPYLPFDYAQVPRIQLVPRDDPNKPGDTFGDCMFYL